MDIVYFDRHFVVVNKPSGQLVASDHSGDRTLLDEVRSWNALKQQEGRKGYCVPIHFIDRPVSGLVIFALSSKCSARLNELFRSRRIEKSYLAVVEGRPEEARLKHLETWLAKDRDENRAYVSSKEDPEAKRCVLSATTLGVSGATTLLRVAPETGRSHQIRAQLASLGTPIVGDLKYGATAHWEQRIALHAFRLSFIHPVSKVQVVFEVKPPPYWRDLGFKESLFS